MTHTKQNLSRPALVLGDIGLIHNLAIDGIPVYTGTEIRENPSIYSKYSEKIISFSEYTSVTFIDELCEFGKTLKQRAVLFSDDDNAILNIAQNQERLEPYYLFSFPRAETVTKMLDKQLFCELIEQHDLPAPRSVTLSSVNDLRDKDLENLSFPCIIKPAFKQSWWNRDFDSEVGDYQKAVKCETYDEMERKYRQIAKVNPRVVVQEFIEGSEKELYSVNMFVGERGDLKGYFIAQKLRTYPIKAGEGSYIKTVQDAEMIDRAMSIANKLDLKGLLNIQFKREEQSGEPVLLEIHTRNSVWSYLGTAAGVNLAAMYYRELCGQKFTEVPEYKPEVTYIFLEKDIKAFIQNLKNPRVSVLKWIGSYRKKFVLSGFQWRDPLPFFMKFWFFIKRKLPALPLRNLFHFWAGTKKQPGAQARHHLDNP